VATIQVISVERFDVTYCTDRKHNQSHRRTPYNDAAATEAIFRRGNQPKVDLDNCIPHVNRKLKSPVMQFGAAFKTTNNM